MKTNLTLSLICLLGWFTVNITLAQAPEKFKYQAVLRDASGNIIPNTSVTVVINILQGSAGGTSVYQETQTVTTTAQGVINLDLGGGTVNSGTFSSINWSTSTYWVKVTLNGTVISTGQLESVPYSLSVKGLTYDPVNDRFGIGTTSPTTKLDVQGAVKIADGTQGANKVLTSDASGNASWHASSAITSAVVASLSSTAWNWTSAAPAYTGSYITLGPGKWSVQVSMLIPKDNDYTASLWVRSTFTNSGSSSTPSSDIVGYPNNGYLASGYKAANAWGMVTGTLIINNTSGSNKTYFYWGEACEVYSGTFNLKNFGTSLWLENQIVAYPMN